MGMRWRTEAEVTAGTGQFSCGARRCGERRGLASFEVPFAYSEAGVDKQALVKARPACSMPALPACMTSAAAPHLGRNCAGAPVP